MRGRRLGRSDMAGRGERAPEMGRGTEMGSRIGDEGSEIGESDMDGWRGDGDGKRGWIGDGRGGWS